ncbi:hypothetical protein Pelo_515 [Pelomyxa schiedti]|nr:hypothetical protein Pelo_515 [Pelomyxa schiedti]
MIGGILGGSGSDCVSVLAMNEKPWVSGDWIDPSRVVAWWERGDRIAIFDGVSGRVSCLLPGPSTALWYRVNSKWSVSSDTTGILTVGKITMHEELQQREPAGGFQTIPSVTLPVTPIFNGLRETCKSNPDKLLLSVDSGRTSRCFYVVDLAESYKRRVLRILSVTHFPVVSTAKILFMEKNNGQDVFIIAYELMEDKLQYRVVIVAADHPQSIVSLSPSVVGGFSLSAAGGFILSVSHTSELDVIDPTSGDVVLHIKLPPVPISNPGFFSEPKLKIQPVRIQPKKPVITAAYGMAAATTTTSVTATMGAAATVTCTPLSTMCFKDAVVGGAAPPGGARECRCCCAFTCSVWLRDKCRVKRISDKRVKLHISSPCDDSHLRSFIAERLSIAESDVIVETWRDHDKPRKRFLKVFGLDSKAVYERMQPREGENSDDDEAYDSGAEAPTVIMRRTLFQHEGGHRHHHSAAVALDARALALALATSSHPRCGRASPARIATQHPAVMRTMWDTWAARCAVRLTLLLFTADRPHARARGAVALSVDASPALGVLGPVAESTWEEGATPQGRSTLWCLSVEGGVVGPPGVAVGHVRDVVFDVRGKMAELTAGVPIGPADLDVVHCNAIDGQWWVWWAPSVVVIETTTLIPSNGGCGGSPSSSTRKWACVRLDGEFWDSTGRGNSEVWSLRDVVGGRPGQALLVFIVPSSSSTVLVTIDVADSFTTGKLRVCGTVHCSLPGYWTALVMKKNTRTTTGSSNYTLIVQGTNLPFGCVWEVDIETGAVKGSQKITYGSLRSRLSESLFSVYKDLSEQSEVWDCNDLSAPRGIVSGGAYLFGGGGFILQVDHSVGMKVKLTDAHSGQLFITLGLLPEPGKYFTETHTFCSSIL